MIVAIDGPAGGGKSSASRRLAGRLGFDYLDTGAFYRAATLRALRNGVSLEDGTALEHSTANARIEIEEKEEEAQRVLLDGRDVTDAIRQPDVTRNIHHLASQPGVRRAINEQLRRVAANRDVVVEGRDIGTVVFPNAEVKIYLDASPEERARRRCDELRRRDLSPDYEQILDEIKRRDERDRNREVGPLKKAEDALVVDTTSLSLSDVVDRLADLVVRLTGNDI